ncbi:hypothetical protein BT96DRAFT_936898 [Gymnopus androsaceus JB14]|uniref:DUF6699 domain-containing protein n=1 Tax=Gymnopus androsaceus JB14 TaxID=1447944 RepID=A0A6A4I0W4_9AGAR|nr:hypothetical protein BT96DRAFT_936898 [Gymnopus androsaceus JB14]
MSSYYSKSVNSVRSHRDSETESWGTVTGSRTSTPTYSHRSNPSYPSANYGPSTPFTAHTPGTPYWSPVPLPQQYNGPTAPPAPYIPTVPLPSVNPLLQYPPKAVFNVTYGCNSIAFRDGASSADVAVYPPVHSLVLGLSCLCPGKRIDVKSSSPNGVTVHDVFAALSRCLLSPISSYELAALSPVVIAQGRATQSARRRTDVHSSMQWVDLLGHHVYFGGLTKTLNGIYELTFMPAPMA